MSRTINSGLLAALTANSVEPFYAVELLFDVKTSVGVDGEVINLGPMRMWTGLGNRTINVRGANQVFAGTGALLNIAAAEEVGDLSDRKSVV